MIRFDNVGLRYGTGPEILRDVTFHVHPGSFHFLTGPSGAGKTTLLRLLFMSIKPSRGLIFVFGENVAKISPAGRSALRRRIGIVFQDFRLLEDRTAEENVAFALAVTGARESTIPTRVMRVLSQVGLAAKAHAYPREMSGGEQQRVTIARALVNEPTVLLADEPTGNLDHRSGDEVLAALEALNAGGITLLVVTHDDEVAARSRRHIRMRDGRVVLDEATAGARA